VLYSCSGEGEIKAWELGPGGGATWLKSAVQTVRLKTAVQTVRRKTAVQTVRLKTAVQTVREASPESGLPGLCPLK
jgi:hypothetical protein